MIQKAMEEYEVVRICSLFNNSKVIEVTEIHQLKILEIRLAEKDERKSTIFNPQK